MDVPNIPLKWRIRAVARLLATDAALKLGEEGFSMSATTDFEALPGTGSIVKV